MSDRDQLPVIDDALTVNRDLRTDVVSIRDALLSGSANYAKAEEWRVLLNQAVEVGKQLQNMITNQGTEPPAPTETVIRVPEDSNLQAALDRLAPDVVIDLGDGMYGGNFTVNKPGGTIRARAQDMAHFGGRWNLAAKVKVQGVKTTYQKSGSNGASDDCFAFLLTADDIEIERCWIDSKDGIKINPGKAKKFNIHHNDFAGKRPTGDGACCHIYIGDVASDMAAPPGYIGYNSFADKEKCTAGSNDNHFIYIGNSKPGSNKTGTTKDLVFDHNFAEGTRSRIFYFKRHVTMEYCVGLGGSSNGFRHGGADDPSGAYQEGGVIMGCYFDKAPINVNDTGALILGNYLGGGSIKLYAGSEDASQPGKFLYQAADKTILVDNNAKIEVGTINSGKRLAESEGGKVNGVKIYKGDHNPVITRNNAGCDADGYTVYEGMGGFLKIEPITPDELRPLVGRKAA